MTTPRTDRHSPLDLPAGYLNHFVEGEFKFRWIDGIELTDAPKGQKHVASTLCLHMSRDGIVKMSIDELQKRTARQRRNIQETLRALTLRGWLVRAETPGDVPVFVARMTSECLHLLVEDRERRSHHRHGLAHDVLKAVAWIETEVAAAYGLDLSNDPPSGWSRLNGALRSTVSRMPSPEGDLWSLHRVLTESPCNTPERVVGLLFKRLGEYRRANAWARHRQERC